jgi:hypothetical protein
VRLVRREHELDVERGRDREEVEPRGRVRAVDVGVRRQALAQELEAFGVVR